MAFLIIDKSFFHFHSFLFLNPAKPEAKKNFEAVYPQISQKAQRYKGYDKNSLTTLKAQKSFPNRTSRTGSVNRSFSTPHCLFSMIRDIPSRRKDGPPLAIQMKGVF